jgi:hypothetical protein
MQTNFLRKSFREIGYEDGRWIKLAQDHVLLRVVLNLQVLLPLSLIGNILRDV